MPEPLSNHPIGSPFIELQSVDSTNNYALAQLHAGLASHGAAFFAEDQFAGKGQHGKTWLAEPGANLILSIVFLPGRELTEQFQLSALIAVSVTEFFSKYAGDETSIKWPNDLYWQDRKAGGILIENSIGPGEAGHGIWKWAVAGIGININQSHFPPGLTNPVSLRQITGREFNPVVLAKDLCGVLEKNWQVLNRQGFDPIFAAYNDRLFNRGREARLKYGSRVFNGFISGVSRTGQLLVGRHGEEQFSVGQLEWFPASLAKKRRKL